MPLSLFFLGAMVGAVVGGYLCYYHGRDERDELRIKNRRLKKDVKRLRSICQESQEVINIQRQYINQFDRRQNWSEEGSKCDPFTDF